MRKYYEAYMGETGGKGDGLTYAQRLANRIQELEKEVEQKDERIAELEKELAYALVEGERLSKVAKHWQAEYYKLKPPYSPPKIDNL